MRIVVNTPAGNIGRVVVDQLLDARHQVVIISRHPDKVADVVAKGASLIRGSIDEESTLDQAFRGADALFWLTPITFDPLDYMAWAKETGQLAALVAQRHSVARAVLISSIGAQHESGVGPISCMWTVERAFTQAVPNVTALRPGSFMENLFQHVGSIAQAGTMFGRYPTSKKIPWIATRDIATSAVAALTGKCSGHRVLELHGPEDLDQLQVAAILSESLGRPIKYVEVTAEQAKQGMIGAGMPSAFADLLLEMYAAVNTGRMGRDQARTPATTTPTTLAEFVQYALRPAVEGALQQ